MDSVIIHERKFIIKITSSEINKAVGDIAHQININLKDKKPLFIAVLNGSFMFASDLMKKITIECEITFVKVASYKGTSTSGEIRELLGINEDIKGRTIIVIEDIVDTGNTIEYIWNSLNKLGTSDVKVATLLFKPEVYTKNIPIEYIGINVSNVFLVGYGLDYNGLGRNLEDIYMMEN
jgi:hypoxanthine phosphoribosyltransferase